MTAGAPGETAREGEKGQATAPPGFTRARFRRWSGRDCREGLDAVVVEDPIEFRVSGEPVAAVMRTPGDDRDLALGFLFGEGWIEKPGDVGSLCLCRTELPGDAGERVPGPNTANLIPVRPPGPAARARRGAVTASCGVCGKDRIADILSTLPPALGAGPLAEPWELSPETLGLLPDKLRCRQVVFEHTGALHAAGIFALDGGALVVREDIGRHNAVDKAIGFLFRAGRLPLDRHVLVVSGRISFEIVQKAARAGIGCVLAVSGVSSLAIALAESAAITLCGFARDGSFSCYSCPRRLRWP